MVYTDDRPISTENCGNSRRIRLVRYRLCNEHPRPVWIMVSAVLNGDAVSPFTHDSSRVRSWWQQRISGFHYQASVANKVKIGVYAICGLLAAVAGAIAVGISLSSAQPTAVWAVRAERHRRSCTWHKQSLAGGRGRIMGVIGALIIGFQQRLNY